MQRLFLSKSQTFLTLFRDHPYLTEPLKTSCASSSSLELLKTNSLAISANNKFQVLQPGFLLNMPKRLFEHLESFSR